MSTKFHHVVVGAGIVGSCTAWQLKKNAKRVLLVDQFRLPHTRGSSHGQTRLTRTSYAEEYLSALIPESMQLWKELEKETGTKLIINSGLWFLSKDKAYVNRALSNTKKYTDGQFQESSAEEFNKKYPTVNYSEDYSVFLDKTGGTIIANKALRAAQHAFEKKGGEILDGDPVDSVVLDYDESTVELITQSGVHITTPSLIVCAGAWTPELFRKNNEDLSNRLRRNLQPVAVNVYYWKCKENYSPDQFPAFIDFPENKADINVYGLIPSEYPGLMKVCIHGGVPCHQDEREKAVMKDFDDKIKPYIAKHFPGLEPEPSLIEKCMYTVTPDENFVLDHLYQHKNVILGCGFSGMGFKISPIVGKIISEIATGIKPSYDLTNFKLSRFE